MGHRSGLILPGVAPKLSPIDRELAAEQSGWYPAEFFLRRPRAVVDQGKSLPCCVSCAISTCVEVLDPSCDQLAPLFHYHMYHSTRNGGYSEGMSLADGLNALARFGICLYSFYPAAYTQQGAMATPDEQATRDALARRRPFTYDSILERASFARLGDGNRINEWKKILLGSRPILLGFYRTDKYEAGMDRLEGTPDLDSPHAVAVLGYRESRRSFLVQDSKGEGFGRIPENPGRWWLPYDMVTGDGNVVEEAYVVGRLPIR